MAYEPDGRFSKIPDEQVFGFLQMRETSPNPVAVDTETHYVPDDKKVTRFLTDQDIPNNTPFIITLSDGVLGWEIELNEITIPHVKRYLENPHIEKVLFNASYDLEMLENIGIKVAGFIHDVMILHNLINEEDKDENGKYLRDLKGLAVKYIDKDADRFEILVDECRNELAKRWGKPKAEITYYDVYLEYPAIMCDYAASDTLYTMQLFNLWYPEISKQGLERIYDIEMECIRAVVKAEMRGHKVDVAVVEEVEENYSKELAETEQKIYGLVGREFNINSDEQLVEAFLSLGAEYKAITDKGNWSTNKTALSPYLEHHVEAVRELAEAVLDYRDLFKTLNTFIAGIKRYTQADGRVHTSFWQAGTRTGRMSSSKPNFQNITKKTEDVRRIFIPEDGYIIAYFDYCQQEYRLLAHYAKETRLIDMIAKGYDVHKATAALLYGIPYEEVTKEQRDNGKRMNFALVYGLGLAAIAKSFGQKIDEDLYKVANAVLQRFDIKPWKLPQLEIILNNLTEEEEIEAIKYYYSDECTKAIAFAKQKKKEYFNQFSKIAEFLDNCKKIGARRGYIKTWTGRRKRYDDPWRESYKFPNALIQGGCGDILKLKAGQVTQFLNENSKYNSSIVNYIHDEIAVEVHIKELHLLKHIQTILDDNVFSVPITTDFSWTNTNWNEKKEGYESLWKVYGEVA